MSNGETTSDRSGLRNALLAILGLSTAVGLVEIFLGLTQDCLNELLVALGAANLVIGGIAATSSLQKSQPGTHSETPGEG